MNDLHIKRVMIALDSTRQSQAALQAAAEMAARLDVELMGLFVEDANLLQLASLPFAREVLYGSSTGRRMDSEDMERSLRTQARRLRKNLEVTASHAQVHCSFRVTRGIVATELLSVANENDLLVLGKVVKKTKPENQLGSTIQQIVTQACCSVALLEHGKTLQHPAIILYEGSETCRHALALAVQLALSDDDHLVIVLPAVSASLRDELKQQVEEMTKSQPIKKRYVCLKHNDVRNLLDIVAREDGQVFIMDATSETWDVEKRRQLLTHSTCPIVVFR